MNSALSFVLLALLTLVLGPAARADASSDEAKTEPKRIVAVTFDDLPVASTVENGHAHLQRVTHGLLDTIARHRIPAIGFVNEGKLWADGKLLEERVALLRQWVGAGLELGNHTYSHIDMHQAPLDDVKAAVVRGDVQIRALLATTRHRPRYFRHPYLRTGLDPRTRQSFEAFLSERGYRVAPVTLDNADYIFAAAYDKTVARGDADTASRIVESYVDYMRQVVGYYEQQSLSLFGREIPQVLLLHANALNAVAFERIAKMLERRGYGFATLDRVLTDAAYRSRDTYFGPRGISWIHRWALSSGKGPDFVAGEPEVPGWIAAAANGAS